MHMKKILLKEEVILTRDEVRNLLSSVPEGCIIDFSNVEFVSLSAAHEFRKIKQEKSFKFINMNEKLNLIFNMDETIRGKKTPQNLNFKFTSLSFPEH